VKELGDAHPVGEEPSLDGFDRDPEAQGPRWRRQQILPKRNRTRMIVIQINQYEPWLLCMKCRTVEAG
jgi:hypothetical protein